MRGKGEKKSRFPAVPMLPKTVRDARPGLPFRGPAYNRAYLPERLPMSPTAALFILAASLSTVAGGLLALRLKSRLPLIMSFTAGVLLGVVFFEIFPEIFELVAASGEGPMWAMLALVGGFLVFHVLEKAILIHHVHEGDYAHHHHPRVGKLSAAALVGHSYLDGLGIGLAFQVDARLGALVALAVIAHDFTDGMNTVALSLRHGNSEAVSKRFLAADALAPILGAVTGLYVAFPESAMVLYLGFFAGFLLYIGASDILPAAHSDKSSYWKILLTVSGAALAFGLSGLHGQAHAGDDADGHDDAPPVPAVIDAPLAPAPELR